MPTVGTFHTYSTARVIGGITANIVGARRLYNKLAARIAVSEAAAWTARRFYGGRYEIVPNGVDLVRRPARAAPRGRGPGDPVRRAAPRAARACRCCCAPSRRCAPPAWAPA